MGYRGRSRRWWGYWRRTYRRGNRLTDSEVAASLYPSPGDLTPDRSDKSSTARLIDQPNSGRKDANYYSCGSQPVSHRSSLTGDWAIAGGERSLAALDDPTGRAR